MELTYKELQKRDVINIVDGKCLGRITDIKFRFPEGKIEGIFVPGRKMCGLALIFSKTTQYIPERNINKIGGDVILVNLSCGETCDENTVVGKVGRGKKPCPPPCTPPCPPCNPPANERVCFGDGEGNDSINFDEY